MKKTAIYFLTIFFIFIIIFFGIRFLSQNDDFVESKKSADEYSPIELQTKTVKFEDGTEWNLDIAKGFDINVAAENMGKARFMTMSPDMRLFVPDMVDYSLSQEGKIFILDDFDEKSGVFKSKSTYLSGLRGPHDIKFYTDQNEQTWIYITLTEHLIRYPYKAGDMEPVGEPEIITTFPNRQSEDATSVVWHITRSILFVDDVLYVAVGSGCNLCDQPQDELRSMILKMDAEGNNLSVFARGIKNAVGIVWAEGNLYVTENGTDHLGDDAPDDLLFLVEEGKHYGWPYCYEIDGKKYTENAIDWQEKSILCKDVPISFASFDPHSAPLGIEYFQQAHPALNGAFLVAFQGSWNPEIGTGYQILKVSLTGEQEIFIDGFQADDGERIGRPVGILQYDKNSFFISEDYNGKIYYVRATP